MVSQENMDAYIAYIDTATTTSRFIDGQVLTTLYTVSQKKDTLYSCPYLC